MDQNSPCQHVALFDILTCALLSEAEASVVAVVTVIRDPSVQLVVYRLCEPTARIQVRPDQTTADRCAFGLSRGEGLVGSPVNTPNLQPRSLDLRPTHAV